MDRQPKKQAQLSGAYLLIALIETLVSAPAVAAAKA